MKIPQISRQSTQFDYPIPSIVKTLDAVRILQRTDLYSRQHIPGREEEPQTIRLDFEVLPVNLKGNTLQIQCWQGDIETLNQELTRYLLDAHQKASGS